MTPYIVTPPSALPVTLSEMKAHLRVVHADDDTDITQKMEGAVAMLDAWGGALNRCIASQVWAVDLIGPGPHRLPFPDASSIVVLDGDATLSSVVERCFDGFYVTAASATPDLPVTVRATYGLPATRIAAAKTLIKLTVERDFDKMSGPGYEANARSIHALIGALRWRRV